MKILAPRPFYQRFKRKVFHFGAFPNANFSVPFQFQRRTLTSVPFGTKYPWPSIPFNYVKWPLPYGLPKFFDYTLERYCDNSRIVAIDGNIAIGKHAFGRRLAGHFDLQFVADFDERLIFVHDQTYGRGQVDIRDFDLFLPEASRPYDRAALFMDPAIAPHSLDAPGVANYATKLQTEIYKRRFENYHDAIGHMLSTGQGAVVVRPAHSDYVVYEAMRRMGWIKDEAFEYYNRYFIDSFIELPSPHLVFFIRAPVDYVMRRIKERGIPWEVNGVNMNEKFIAAINEVYEDDYLPKMRKTSEVLEIEAERLATFTDKDWEYLIEDIEKIDLNVGTDFYNRRFEDWRPVVSTWRSFSQKRSHFTSIKRCKLILDSTVPYKKIEEMFTQPLQFAKLDNIANNDPRFSYDPQFNPLQVSTKDILGFNFPFRRILRSPSHTLLNFRYPRLYYIERVGEFLAYREKQDGYRYCAEQRYNALVQRPWRLPSHQNYEEFDFMDQMRQTSLYQAYREGRLDDLAHLSKLHASQEARKYGAEVDQLIHQQLASHLRETVPGNFSAGDPMYMIEGPPNNWNWPEKIKRWQKSKAWMREHQRRVKAAGGVKAVYAKLAENQNYATAHEYLPGGGGHGHGHEHGKEGAHSHSHSHTKTAHGPAHH